VEEILNDEDARLFVVEQGGVVIALAEATLRESPNFALLTPHRWVDLRDIVVDERFRGGGIGKALLAHVEAWARSLGITRIELTVWEFNASARTLYERQGFHTLNRAMSKDLDG
jgi:GNAT superfamily N-acetyltransferase